MVRVQQQDARWVWEFFFFKKEPLLKVSMRFESEIGLNV